MQEQFKRNRLDDATSPYLLQHKDNPVHWQPWEAAVFDEARRRNVPVLLSIGYAACHWCHVMAHESFEDNDVAAQMNAHFVCIKLDREERPDLDDIYMNALHMMGEQGGWPLTACLDADGRPFWGGTYFPKTPQYGRPGFMQILTEISRIWHEEPEKVSKNTQALSAALTAQAETDARGDMPADLPARAATALTEHMDTMRGGLTGAPKFPQPFLYQYLWHHAQLHDDQNMRDAVLLTLEKICQGGIYDHIGGGFARYSVDADWLVPHFEKMLYDNALMIDAMTRVWRDTKSPLLAARIDETIDWLLREMTLTDGAFAASLDADTEGEEGKFYIWSKTEIDTLLDDDAEAFSRVYDITAAGNFEGRNIPNLLTQSDTVFDRFDAARSTLLKARNQRPAPGRDDKILADWNGMMITALAEAGVTFNRPDWCTAAAQAFHAARGTLTDAQGNLCHSARDGQRLDVSLATDYAFMGQAAAALYRATGQADYLDMAVLYGDTLRADFHDAARGGYRIRAHAQTAQALVNARPVHDNAQPSANAAIYNLFNALAVLTGQQDYATAAQDLFTALSAHLAKNFSAMTAMLDGYYEARHPLSIIIVSPADSPASRAAMENTLAHAAHNHPIAYRQIVSLSDTQNLPPKHPAHGKQAIDGQPTAYICPAQSCLPPVTQTDELINRLDALLTDRQTKAAKLKI